MVKLYGRALLLLTASLYASGTLAAQGDVESTFQEAVKLVRLGRKQEAVAKFEEVLKADPSHEQAFELWRKTNQDVWHMLLAEQGEVQKIAMDLLGRAKLSRKEAERDEAKVGELVEQATSGDYGQRRTAIRGLIENHREFAVPALVAKLSSDTDETVNHAILALVELGDVATLPLIESLQSPDVQIRRNAAAALALLKDRRAAAGLAQLTKDENAIVRETAAAALRQLGVQPEAGAADLYLRQAQQYLNRAGIREVSDVVWAWHEGKLVAVDVPAVIYHLELAKKNAARALDLDPTSEAAKSLLARTYLAEAVAIRDSAAGGDEKLQALQEKVDDLKLAAVATGSRVLRRAMQESLQDGMVDVAVAAIDGLGRTEDRNSVGSSPLVEALRHEDKRVAYASALAISKVAGGGQVPAAQDVVRDLGAAVSEEALRIIRVVGGQNDMTRAAKEAGHMGRGIVVDASDRGLAAINDLFVSPSVDVVVVNETLPDVRPEHLIGLMRRDSRFADTKIVVVCDDEAAASERFGDKIDAAIKGPLTGEALRQKVDELLKDAPMPARRARADEVAVQASESLAQLAEAQVDISSAVNSLAAQLDRADAVAVPAARALGHGGTPAQLEALVKAVQGGGSEQLKVEAAKAIGRILGRSDAAPENVVAPLLELVGNAEPQLRGAIVAALAKARLAPGDQLKVIEKLRVLSSPAAMPAAPAAAAEGEAGNENG